MNDSLKELQLIEKKILEKCLEIFKKYKLRYFILGGTLLGAVRHKGFIPWDDDIDIGLPRPDYEKFLEVAQKELVFPYDIHTTKNNRGVYSYYYARVVDYTKKIKRNLAEKDVLIPVWVDVFPLDGVPDNELDFKLWKLKCNYYFKIFSLAQAEYFYKKDITTKGNFKAARTLLKRIFFSLNIQDHIDKDRAWNLLDRELKKYDYRSTKRLINFCGAWRFKEMFPKSVYGEGKLYRFEDLMLNGPENYDFVLTQMYGDYMTPPPEDQRNHHSIELIEV